MLRISQQNNVPADRLSEIARLAYQQYVAAIGKPPAPMTADYQHHIAEDIIFIAQIADRIIGFAIIIEKSDGYWLETIAIHPDNAGQGIGTLLMAEIETYLRPKTNRYQLYTNQLMTRPQSWYKRLGFTETDRKKAAGFQRIYYDKSI